jgi:HlyD family secretion protein
LSGEWLKLLRVESNVTSFEVRVDILSDAKRLLRSGMNVDVEFQVGELNQAIIVPTVAIVRQTDQTGVYVLDEDGKPVFTPIETGVTIGNQTEVVSGLQDNQHVVISGPIQTLASPEGPLPLPEGRPPS